MRQRFSFIVPTVREVGVLTLTPYEAGAGHAEAREVRVGEIPDVESQSLLRAAVLDDELQKDHAFAGVTEVRAGVEVDVNLLVGLDKPEVAEAGGMGEA